MKTKLLIILSITLFLSSCGSPSSPPEDTPETPPKHRIGYPPRFDNISTFGNYSGVKNATNSM